MAAVVRATAAAPTRVLRLVYAHGPAAVSPASEPPPPPPPPSGQQQHWDPNEHSAETERDPDFHVNRGRALRAVVRDTNEFFARASDLDLNVYEPGVFFKENVFYEFSLQGLTPYGRMLRWSRLLLRMYYAEPELKVTRVVERSTFVFSLAWRFTAVPPRSLPLAPLLGFDPPKPVVYEGYSVYGVSRRGLINTHVIENVEPTPQPLSYAKRMRMLLNIEPPLASTTRVPLPAPWDDR